MSAAAASTHTNTPHVPCVSPEVRRSGREEAWRAGIAKLFAAVVEQDDKAHG